MRIKIIGDNNCARATRHLLRLAGFAVTEFLPAEAITQAPHFGFAITIDVIDSERVDRAKFPSSGYTPPAFVPDSGTSAGFPTSMPDHSTQVVPADADREASAFAKATADVSALVDATANRSAVADARAGASSSSNIENGDSVSAKARRAVPLHDSIHPGAVTSHASIHFDSVDSALEAAVLRHVAQLAVAPVIVDRPGGVVHSERELRMVIPRTGDAKADEAAAVAVEFGVLRGLLDLTAPRAAAKAEKSVLASRASGSGRKWWRFGIFALAGALLPLAAIVQAIAPDSGVTLKTSSPSSRTGFSVCGLGSPSRVLSMLVAAPTQTRGTQAEACATGRVLHSNAIHHVVTDGAYLRLTAGRVPLPVALRPRLAASTAAGAPAQGEFAVGQQTKITDGTNTLVIDPCKGQTKAYVSINQTANTQLAAGSASQKIYICSIHVVVAAATNVALVEGTGSVCATSTAGVNGFGGSTAATGWNFAANGGIVLGTGDAAVGAEGASGDNLCLYNSGSGQVSGGISYVVQ